MIDSFERRQFARLCAIALLIALPLNDWATESWAAETGVSMRQSVHEFRSDESRVMNYLLYLPDGYGQSDATFPLVMFLHGGGEGGDDIELVKKHGPPKLIQAGQDYPFIVVSPQNPSKTQFWDDQQLIRLLDHVIANHRVDTKRLYLTGMSRGGFGTWRTAIQNPNRFAAIVPVCGGGDVPYVGRIKHVPTWVFHGAKDPTIPLGESEEMVIALRDAGGTVKFTIYPDTPHDAWTKTYENPKLYEWMLNQSIK